MVRKITQVIQYFILNEALYLTVLTLALADMWPGNVLLGSSCVYLILYYFHVQQCRVKT